MTEIYTRRCAVTKERTLPALDAAHIRPYREGGKHEPPNGLLLRSDIHRLFDKGYVTDVRPISTSKSAVVFEKSSRTGGIITPSMEKEFTSPKGAIFVLTVVS